MAEPLSYRVLELVRAWFAADPSAFPVVGLDEPEFATGYVPKVGRPELYVILVEGSGAFGRETEAGVIESLGVQLVGFVQAAADEVPEGESELAPVVPQLARTRERFLQAVLARLHAEVAGDSLRKRLEAEAEAHPDSQCSDLKPIGGPIRDRGETAPLGWFVIPCDATLHYRDGAF